MKKRNITKRIFFILLAGIIFLSACGMHKKEDEKGKGAIYLEAMMESRYHGNFEPYVCYVDADTDNAKVMHEAVREYYARQLMLYNGVNEKTISKELFSKYEELAGTILEKTAFFIRESEGMEEEGKKLEVVVRPLNLNDISATEIKRYMESYNEMFDGMDLLEVTEEQWQIYEETYGQNVYSILEKYVTQAGYKKEGIVNVPVDSKGRPDVSEEFWYELDDLLVGMTK